MTETHLHVVTDALSARVARCSRDLRYLWVSRPFAAWMGRPPEEIVGRPIAEVIGPEAFEKLSPYFEKALSGEIVRYEEEINLRGLGRQWISAVYTPTFDPAGVPDGWVTAIVDIDERKRSEAALIRFQFSMEHAPEAVFFMTRDAGFFYVNKQACLSLGYTRDELLGLKLWEIDPIYPKERWEKVWAEPPGPADKQSLETLHRRKDGTVFPVEVSGEHLRLGEHEFHVAFVRDITRRKEAAEALKAAEARLRLALQAGRIGTWDWNMTTGQIVWSRGHEELWGMAPGTFKGTYEEFDARLHPADRDGLSRAVARAAAARRTFRHDFRIVSPDGGIRWVAGQGEPFFDDAGKPVRMIGVVRDITEQRRAEEEISLLQTIILAIGESPNLSSALRVVLEKICEATGWGIGQAWIPQPDGKALLCSPAWYGGREGRFEKFRMISKEMVLSPGEGLPGRAFASKQPVWARDVSQEQNCLRAPYAGEVGVKSGVAVPVLAGDQVLAVLEWYMPESRDEDERLIRLVSALASQLGVVIGRKRSEEALAAEKERLAVTIRSIGDGVIATDTEGKILLMNKVAESLTGWVQAEALGRPLDGIFSIIDEKSRAALECPAVRVFQTGKTVNPLNHTILVARDGTERIISDRAAPIRDQQGEIIGVILVFRNITDERKKEEDLIRMSKLEAVGLLAGGIAHDFNNILTAILGNLSLIKMELDSAHPLYRRFEDAETASLRARDLSQQLLTFSKGGAPIKKTILVKELIERSIQFALRGSNVHAAFSLSEGLWPVDIDEGQISQVLHNLVINAQQAMPEGGTLQVRAENYIETGSEKRLPVSAGRYIRILVQDFGIGIRKEHLDKIFDPYFTTKQKGSGFGLSTSYSIVKKHDGHMTVDSRLGKGSTFSVYLPASSKEIEPPAASEVPLRGKGKILIMDDEAAVREVAGAMLRFLGYEVDFAEDGSEAIARYLEAKETGRPFDLIVMDLTIPGKLGGREAIQRLLELDPAVKAIVSSGYSIDPIMGDYTQYGFKGVIAKPYRMEDLSKTVRKVIADPGKK